MSSPLAEHWYTSADALDTEGLVARAGAVPRRITIRLARWGEVADTPQGPETFVRGAFAHVDPTTVHIESQRHLGDVVGIGERIEERDDGAYLVARMADTQGGRDLVSLIGEGIMSAASVLFRPITTRTRPDGTLERVRADLRRVAVLSNGAYPSAQVVEMRHHMSDTESTQPAPAAPPTPVAPVATPSAPPAPAAPDPDMTALLGRFDELDAAISAVDARASFGAGAQRAQLLGRFDTFGDAFLAAADDHELNDALARQLSDNITGDNPGLILPGNYISRIVNPAAVARKAINAFGGAFPLPPKGMSFEWPAFDPSSDFTVTEQIAEKDVIGTGTSKWRQMSQPVRTFAGGSDNSLQLLQRSSPSFRELLLAHFAREWARKTNTEYAAILEATGTTDTITLDGTDHQADADALRALLFKQSMWVETELGMPASIVLAASDVFQRLGENGALVPPVYGTVNVSGVAQASTLRINVSGLEIVHEPMLSLGAMITSAPPAAGWGEDGPRTIEALNVAQLGRDIAIYSFGNGAIFHEAAVINTTVTLV